MSRFLCVGATQQRKTTSESQTGPYSLYGALHHGPRGSVFKSGALSIPNRVPFWDTANVFVCCGALLWTRARGALLKSSARFTEEGGIWDAGLSVGEIYSVAHSDTGTRYCSECCISIKLNTSPASRLGASPDCIQTLKNKTLVHTLCTLALTQALSGARNTHTHTHNTKRAKRKEKKGSLTGRFMHFYASGIERSLL